MNVAEQQFLDEVADPNKTYIPQPRWFTLDKHIIKLIDRDKQADGWTPVSDQLYPVLSGNMPSELVEFSGDICCYKAMLTVKGNDILMAMEWL